MNNILKGLFLAIVAFILAQVQTAGWPVNLIEWEVLGLSVFGIGLTYFGQSAWIPTTSKIFGLDLTDLIKGGVMAIGTFLTTIGVDALLGTSKDIGTILLGVLAVVGTYITKQFITTVKPV